MENLKQKLLVVVLITFLSGCGKYYTYQHITTKEGLTICKVEVFSAAEFKSAGLGIDRYCKVKGTAEDVTFNTKALDLITSLSRGSNGF